MPLSEICRDGKLIFSLFLWVTDKEEITTKYSYTIYNCSLENLRTCYDLISKHGTALQRALADLESGDDLANKSKIVNERATLFRITSNAMINVSLINCFFL